MYYRYVEIKHLIKLSVSAPGKYLFYPAIYSRVPVEFREVYDYSGHKRQNRENTNGLPGRKNLYIRCGTTKHLT